MNKTAVKNFAVWARNKLITDITFQMVRLGITAEEIKKPLSISTKDAEFYDIGTSEPVTLTGAILQERRLLVKMLEQKAKTSSYQKALANVVEEIAYTWFNRLIAIRFMEVNGYLPSKMRLLSAEGSDKLEPDIVTRPFDSDMEFTAEEKDQIRVWQNENKIDELFRLLFIKECRILSQILPDLFATEEERAFLLFGLSVVDVNGVIYHLVHDIPEEDFDIEKGGQVEIIGWLYQYYNTEPKDKVFALPKSVKLTKEDIPAATQIFTPDWIVRYMVENSLGRLWVEGHYDQNLKAGWRYYLDEAEQEETVQEELAKIRAERKNLKVEDMKFLDPCMGSGHILVYAFDVFMQIYTSKGYTARDAVQAILTNNLYGLDIDKRAYQLAYFALMMKARQYDKRIFSRLPKLNICEINESTDLDTLVSLKADGDITVQLDLDNQYLQMADYLISAFVDAKEYGSLLNIKPQQYDNIMPYLKELEEENSGDVFLSGWLDKVMNRLPLLIKQAKIMSQQYDVVVTNPPYMGGRMPDKVGAFVKKYYNDSKGDLFAAFIEKCAAMTVQNGYQAMLTQHSWMFLASYEKLREKLQEKTILNMAHLGAHAFDDINGEVVQVASFVLTDNITDYNGIYLRLIEPTTEAGKRDMFLSGENRYAVKQEKFTNIPGRPVAYWVSEKVIDIFSNDFIDKIAFSDGQILTGDNEKYLRHLWEVNAEDILKNKQWVLHAKGGEYRRWYGNIDTVVSWSDESIKHYKTDKISRFPKKDILFRNGLTWSLVSSSDLFGMRLLSKETTFNKAAASILFKDESIIPYCLGFVNSVVTRTLLKAINPTINTNIKDVLALPFILKDEKRRYVEKKVLGNIAISRTDWDSFETSWDFQEHPMMADIGDTLEERYEAYKAATEERFLTLKANEEELNRIFIDIYGLGEELTPEVADKYVTVARIFDDAVPASMKGNNYVLTKADVVKSLISYAVGCMFGRYSLDERGLIYAGGEWQFDRYKAFAPDADNVLPITDEAYFEDDIVGIFFAWLKSAFGREHLEENIAFIASALGGSQSSTSRDIIRKYFLNDFYKDHVARYQKRPIYWLYDSGKNNGFKGLIYMHRYDEDTTGRVRMDYLHRMEQTYESEMAHMQMVIDDNEETNQREAAKARKRKDKLQKQLVECRRYDEILAHLANARIGIDLDDGVKVNYEKIQQAEEDGKTEKYTVLAKI